MRIEHQLRAFDAILSAYDGKLPLHRFLLNYYKAHKQMGSSDRRNASRYLYSYFRLGNVLKEVDTHTRLAVGDFLCSQTLSLVVENFLPTLVDSITSPLSEKLRLIKEMFPKFDLVDVFRWQKELSKVVETDAFLPSFFVQPDLFIHVNESRQDAVSRTLIDAGISFSKIDTEIFALPNGSRLDQILPADSYRVQDLSSQATAALFQPNKYDYWWDCCAASGGKSLLLHEKEPNIQLLVSDIRQSVLDNLDERFEREGLVKYHKKVLDLLQDNEQILHHYLFDGIVLDAPCTGSGTWGRTPEMLTFFEPERIAFFSKLQRSIAENVIRYLKPRKPLIYITCSVFKAENEDNVQFLLDNFPLLLEKMEMIKGYENKADTMFVARLVKKEI